MRLLLIEDDRLLAEGIKDSLKMEGYALDWIQDGESSIHALLLERFDLAILDLGLPDLEGLSVLEIIRRGGCHIPVLILTSRDSIQDRIKGLDAGADDYLVKPFDSGELKARIRALIRRCSGRSIPRMIHGDISCDPTSHQVMFKEKEVKLTRREYVILKELLRHAGKVLSKEHLSQSISGWHDSIASNTIEVHVHNLRKKFYSKLIKNIRGIGYTIGFPTANWEGCAKTDNVENTSLHTDQTEKLCGVLPVSENL